MSHWVRGGDCHRDGVILGIDAGGSCIRAQAVHRGLVLYEGAGGPGNPLSTEAKTLLANYKTALTGCPEPTYIAACVSGAGCHEQRLQIAELLGNFFPQARVLVFPDYVAAYVAAPAGTDVTVIAGTGSLVCSQLDDGTFANSGGRGWILGDHGSAARLGRAALEWFCDDPAAVGKDFTDAVIDLFGSSDWRHIQRALGSAPSRSAYLARAAPLLTSAADYGADWAITRLRDEMSGLATTTCHHIERYLRREDVIKVALAGGVWASQQASSCYGAALASACPAISITRSSLSSLDGAVRLATRMAS